jgi:hypothetical protein
MWERDVMRSLNRNKRPTHYALFEKDEPILDENGYETGESTPIYGEIQELHCNVSAATGEEAVQAFGTLTDYMRVICVSDNHCTLAENAIVWFGIDTTAPHNYIVQRKADSKNGILYALQEVRVRT